MIKEKTIIINGHSSNYKYYRKLGYDVFIRKPFEVKVNDLMSGSAVKITSICSVCDRETKNTFKDYYIYTNGLINPFFCNKCKIVKSEKTCIDKYGFKNPMQCDSVKNILKESIREKYGVEHYSNTDEYKIKFKNTINKKYGVNNPFESQAIKDKIKLINNERYGVDYPLQNEDIRKKSDITCLNKYNYSTYSRTDSYKIKVKETNIEKYGVEFPSQATEIKLKTKKSNIEKYGVEHISKTNTFKENIKSKRERNTNKKFAALLADNYNVLSYKDDIFHMIHKKCHNEFIMNKGLVYVRNKLDITICSVFNPIGLQHSGIELSIRDFLDKNNIEYITGDRKKLNGKELDIYIQSHNIAIEVNGLYWHSELYKNSKYHIDKTIKCKENGIELLHIWEDDLKNKKDIVESIISNKLKLNNEKVYARKCSIKLVSSKDAKIFLNKNHIQGFSSSSVKLGLYYNNELISLMTFGYRYTNSKNEYELIRFCNKINLSVIGSASKLFSFFINNYEIDEIISYADISIFNGNLYNTLGFKKTTLSKPNYFWVVDGVRKHRFNFNKKKLIKDGFDANKTEVEIMHDRGYYRVFSCGQEKWIFQK